MKIAVVGATGVVGGTMLSLLEQRNFPVTELLPVASSRSVGQTINFKGQAITIVSAEEAIARKPQLALFSAGGSCSLELAPQFAAIGTTVIDNSSAWRMHPEHKLIVPEINAEKLSPSDKIIANPNCSTIQMVMVMWPLHNAFKIKRAVVSTYQSVTGTGQKAITELNRQRKGDDITEVYPYPIDLNLIPQIDVFLENGYTKEEMKMVQETCKIMGDDNIKVTATCVRVPVMGGHSESLNLTFENKFELSDVRNILSTTPGVVLQDDVDQFQYPMPLYATGKDEVFVGRLRRDFTLDNSLNCWIVSDNLRKGAATNAVQIAEYLIARPWFGG